jgi:hypothetical protein
MEVTGWGLLFATMLLAALLAAMMLLALYFMNDVLAGPSSAPS